VGPAPGFLDLGHGRRYRTDREPEALPGIGQGVEPRRPRHGGLPEEEGVQAFQNGF